MTATVPAQTGAMAEMLQTDAGMAAAVAAAMAAAMVATMAKTMPLAIGRMVVMMAVTATTVMMVAMAAMYQLQWQQGSKGVLLQQ